jgi:cellulose synthase/poly-beta-1,6-N-acetylglucosamine synthase-like glycosyltransferase
MAAILLEEANLRQTHLEGAILRAAHLEGAILHEAYLQGANLRAAYLEGANLYRAQLQDGYLRDAHLQGADLRGAFLDTASTLTNATLSDRQFGSLFLTDIHWGDANLATVRWSQIKMLGEEHVARQKKRNDGEKKDKATQVEEYQSAVRGNRQLSVALQNQGLNEDAAYFAYRAQVLQKTVFWLQMLQSHISLRQRLQSSGAWLFSWFLFLLAGYGYKLWRSFLAYLLVIGIFTSLYLLLTPHLVWYEAIVVSMTAFHGRGFSPNTFSPGDPLSIASAFEAFVGLIIEVTFIATLTQRFFNK